MNRLLIVVGRGAPGSPSVVLDGDPKSIGRGRGSDLTLADPSISRKHLEARRVGDEAELRVLDDAMPFLHRGKPARTARLGAGEHLIVGGTVLTVVAPDGAPASSRLSPRRGAIDDESLEHDGDVATIIEGLASEVRSFAAVVRLVEAIEKCSDAPSLEASLGAWAEQGSIAKSVSLVESSAGARELLTSRGTVLTIAVPGHALALRIEAKRRIDDALRGVALVAASILSARLSELRARAVIEEENRVLRALGVGSAREFLGDSPAARKIARVVPKLAASDSTALITGESGTGKTFLARLVHEASARKNEPLRVVNCAAIPESLVESELFGSERGAFSGAVTRAGAFESAGRGTLLLDEIGELPLTSQAKILRALEERSFERVGSNRALPLEARILAATNRDLEAMVEKGTFRADLFFRVSVVTVHVPALRERGDDLVLLARRLLSDLAPTGGRRVSGFTPAALEVIRRHAWPGNVRELRNAIEHALVLGEGFAIDAGDLPDSAQRSAGPSKSARAASSSTATFDDESMVKLPSDLASLEARAIVAALHATGGNRSRAAEILGINRVTLQKKLKKG